MHINDTKTHRFKNLLPLDYELVPFMPSKKAVKLDTGSAAGGAPVAPHTRANQQRRNAWGQRRN